MPESGYANLLGPISNTDPAGAAKKITKSATNDIWGDTYSAATSRPCRGLCVGTAGTATFIDAYGNTCTDYPLQAGYNPIRIKQLLTGGGADDIWALEK